MLLKIAKFITLFISSISILTPIVVTSCGVNVPVSIEKITLNKSNLKLDVNKTEQLIAIVEPENATNKDVTWSSSNPDVATVDEDG